MPYAVHLARVAALRRTLPQLAEVVTSLSGPAKEDGDDAGHYAPGTPKHLTICQMFWTNKRENHTGVKE